MQRAEAVGRNGTRGEGGARGRWAALRAWRPAAWLAWPSLAFLLFFAYGMAFVWGHYMFLDLRVYMGAAHELLIGHDPYDHSFTFVKLYATYPPFAMAVLAPFSVVPVHVMVYLWSLASLACLALLLSLALGEVGPLSWRMASRPWRALLSLLLALVAVIAIQPVRANFGFGQINIFLMTMSTADVLRKGRRGRGVLIGLAAAVKFTPLIFVVALVLERDWRAVMRSITAFITVTAVTWLIVPSISARYFLHFNTMDKKIGTPTYVSNQSVNGILHRLGMGGAFATVTWFVLSVAVIAVAAMVARRLLDTGQSVLLVLLVIAVAGLLASPISWDHHWSWVALFPLALLDKSLRRPVRAGFLAVIIVAVAAFYWWHYADGQGYGIPTGPFTQVADDSLALAGIAFIGTWAWVLRKQISLKDLSPRALLVKTASRTPDQSPSGPLRLPGEPARLAATPLEGRASLERRQRWRKNTSPSRRRAFDRPE